MLWEKDDLVIPDMPPVPCPDCGGEMVLRFRQENHISKSPFFYQCSTRGCSGNQAAHPDGRPAGIAAPKPVRYWRRRCHEVFDQLWLKAHLLPCYRHAFKKADRATQLIVTRATRTRAYLYMAHHLGVEPDDAHLGEITDLDLLRRFYAVATAASAKKVRTWWKREGAKLYRCHRRPA